MQLRILYFVAVELTDGCILEDAMVVGFPPFSLCDAAHLPDIDHAVFASRGQILAIDAKLHTPNRLSRNQLRRSRRTCVFAAPDRCEDR